MLAAAFVIFARKVAVPAGILAGALAAIGGALVAERLSRARYRLPVIMLIAAAIALGGALFSWLSIGASIGGALLGPVAALEASDVFRFGGLAMCASLALRATAIRFRAALAIEGSVVVLAVAATVAAHRDGMIARPLEVSDWFWSQGIDPVVAFLGIGVLGALLLAGVLAYGRSGARTLVQLVVVLVVAVILAAQIHSRDPLVRRDVIGDSTEDKDKKARDEARQKAREQARNGGGGGSGGSEKQHKKPNQQPFDRDAMPQSGGAQNRPTAVVVFHKGVMPAGGVFYFRHAAFSQYNGTRLVEATVSGVDADARHKFPTERVTIPEAEHEADGARELVANDVALLSDHSRMFMLTDGVEVEPLLNPEPARFRRAYRVVSSVVTAPYDELLGRAPGDPAWSEEAWAHYTSLPRDERYHRLAAELQGDLRAEYQGDPIAEAMVVKQYLEKEATYSFARSYEGEDPTADFLFSEDKRGYCVHLAHSAAYLLRAMGVPARVSAGYAVPAGNLGTGSSLLLKASDAHAWAEIYLAGTGWVPVEVTPEKSDVEPTPFAERDLQSLLGEMARKEGRASREPQARIEWWKMIKEALALVPWILLGMALLAYAIKLWRLIAPWIVARRHRPLTAYRAGLDRLAAVGVLRERGESRERFAQRAGAIAESFRPLSSSHVAVALGSRAERQRDGHLPALALGVGGELRRRVPWWRWLLGLVNPISWLWSR
ncbi:MAG: transglutaminase domain-containing protein [Deltaproteobacteria bacterium]|nr:transglutaminase domain-containing protein [Deltaproteobacteria bacterium]